MINAIKHNLFSYGTLQLDNVQIKNYGRLLVGTKDSLKQYKLDKIRITDLKVLKASGKEFHPIALKTSKKSDTIEGTIFEITEHELLQTDNYEVSDYKRVLETFVSGKKAWIYVENNEDFKY
jgi:gamma-glutamylcyclotransferase (GGCT)/AIG2-like uncharacterized protein YtfP